MHTFDIRTTENSGNKKHTNTHTQRHIRTCAEKKGSWGVVVLFSRTHIHTRKYRFHSFLLFSGSSECSRGGTCVIKKSNNDESDTDDIFVVHHLLADCYFYVRSSLSLDA